FVLEATAGPSGPAVRLLKEMRIADTSAIDRDAARTKTSCAWRRNPGHWLWHVGHGRRAPRTYRDGAQGRLSPYRHRLEIRHRRCGRRRHARLRRAARRDF